MVMVMIMVMAVDVLMLMMISMMLTPQLLEFLSFCTRRAKGTFAKPLEVCAQLV